MILDKFFLNKLAEMNIRKIFKSTKKFFDKTTLHIERNI